MILFGLQLHIGNLLAMYVRARYDMQINYITFFTTDFSAYFVESPEKYVSETMAL